MSNSPLQLPPLHQAVLDAVTVDALFHDLASCTQVLAVVPRRTSRTMAVEAPIDLSAARAGLADGSLRGVQVRYRYDQREWCDTLMPLPGGAARVVRICTDDVAASAEPS